MTAGITMNQLIGPGAGRRAVRRRHSLALPGAGRLPGVERSSSPGWSCRRWSRPAGPQPPRPRHRRGLPLDVGQQRRPHADRDDRHVQRHLRRGVVGARALRDRDAGHGPDRIRPAHHRRSGGRPRRDGGLRLARAARQPGDDHAGRPARRDVHELGLALTTTPWVAMPIMFVFGAHAFIWGTTSRTVRMRAVPIELQGRVGSLYAIGVFGGHRRRPGVGGVIAQAGASRRRSGSPSSAPPSCWP